MDDSKLQKFVKETDIIIKSLCDDVNAKMRWMKTGVMIAFVPSMTALIISVYLLWKVMHP